MSSNFAYRLAAYHFRRVNGLSINCRLSDAVMLGTKIAHYVVETELGRGGMGVLFRAKDTWSGCLRTWQAPKCGLSSFWPFGPWVLYANMGSKLYVAASFVLFLHFIKRVTSERTRRLELPVTLGAAEALKILALNPF